MKARMLVILGALIMAAGFVSGSGGAAYAQGGDHQYCFDNYCLNDWNEGLYVNAYTPSSANNNFTLIQNGQYWNISYAGPGQYADLCVSDYGNSSTDARAGLDGNCSLGNIAWGANFTKSTCMGNGVEFWNVHWGGYLAPASLSDGSAFYLNSSTQACFAVLPPA